ncbi:helix-turn-helix transcriptional regulator [Paenibacillus sp. MMO-177]|uniref:helix-turn-helix transcriptional regulator n=1 Tax=Paenibacillus sp. MMO-177 TaxID=3081289 RepID=UPI003017AC02
MKLNIGSKIINMRKEKSVTQEQLANAVGVSIAAVSKWENGNTYPDITLLPEIASFFNVSVDALLDYKVEPKNAQDYRDRIKEITKTSDFNIGLPLAEEALKKYPNDFEILLQMGHLTLNKGTSSESPDKETVLKSIDYFNKALSVQPSDTPVKKKTSNRTLRLLMGPSESLIRRFQSWKEIIRTVASTLKSLIL